MEQGVASDAAASAASPEQCAAAALRRDELRWGRKLVEATRPYASESVPRSWWYVLSTFSLLILDLSLAGWLQWWPLRTALSLLGALLTVRAFILFHDFAHGAILRGSRAAAALFHVYGAFALAPVRIWRDTHNAHHGSVGEISAHGVGAFPLLTTQMWRQASQAARASYRVHRHPLIVLGGYLTVFAFSLCLLPMFLDPRRYWDSALSLLGHAALIAVLWVYAGFWTAFFVVLLPMAGAAALGTYVFYAQHSFKRMQVLSPESWSFYRAALVSSSYMKLNRLLQWFTGNIGYHHVHHLNVRIPFYRLPEAMAAIPELQCPVATDLSCLEILRCFRANLWDEGRQRMVSYREAAKAA